MIGCLVALLCPELVLLAERLVVFTIIGITCVYVQARYRSRKWKTHKADETVSRIAILALLGFPLLGLSTAILLATHRITDPIEVAEVFSHRIFWGVVLGLTTGTVVQMNVIAGARVGVWDREMDRPIDDP